MNGIGRRAGMRRWTAPTLLALLSAVYLWEVVTLAGVPVARDMQLFFVPQKHLLWEALRAGDLPLWTPHVGTGAPFLANFQTGVFYPPNWTFAALPFFAGFNFLVALHFLAGGLFAWMLARELGLARIPAFGAAATWTFGGYFASLLNLMNALQAAAWAPGLAWVLLRHLRVRSAGSWLGLVAVLALALLAGEPQTFLLASATAGTAAVLRLAAEPPERRDALRWLAGVGAAGALVLGLGAVQILPTLELLAESTRGGGGLTYEQVSAYPIEPVRLVHLLVPPDYRDPQFAFGLRSVIGSRSAWLFSLYLGPVWLLLFWFAWRDREGRREVVAWTALAAVGVVVGLGGYTPVFPWLYDHVPGVGSFRFPEKYFFLTAFSAALLAGHGARALLAGRRGRADAPAALCLLGALVAARVGLSRGREALEAYAAAHFPNPRLMLDFDWAYGVWGENLTKLLVVAALGILLIALHRRGRLRTPLFGVLLVGLLAGDLIVAHRDLNPVVEKGFYERPPLLARSVPLDSIRTRYRYRATDFRERPGRLTVLTVASLESQKWLWQQILAPNAGQRWGVLQPDTWDAIKLRRYEDERAFYRILADDVRRWRLLRLVSVRYLYSQYRLAEEGERVRRLPLDPALPGHLYELRDPLPRAYVVPRARRVADGEAAINAALDPGFDPTTGVILVDSAAVSPDAEEPPVPRAARAAPAGPAGGRARILSDTGDELRVAVDGARGGFLVLTDSHFPGWRAYVDGERRPIELANFFFRAVELRAGDRQVTFRYEPPAFRAGAAVSLATLLAAILVAIGGFARRRRSRGEG